MKYEKLKSHLQSINQDRVTMTFAEIEEILGFSLPNSAYKHRAWWSNTDSHTQARAWLDAGWKVSIINQGRDITFDKISGQAKDEHEIDESETIFELEGDKNREIGEKAWIKQVVSQLQQAMEKRDQHITVESFMKLPYAYEITSYHNDGINDQQLEFETDICFFEEQNGVRKPRIVIEGKIFNITTHDAITYSQKALLHKNVHPYLRYGIFLGRRKNYPLPGRLYRHGVHFDFMISWQELVPTSEEWENFLEVVMDEIEASRTLEEILYNSRSPKRSRFHTLHRPLILK